MPTLASSVLFRFSPIMKAAYCIALIALLAVATLASASSLNLHKKARKPLTAAQERLVALGHGVPLQGNIPQYGEYVTSLPLSICDGLSPNSEWIAEVAAATRAFGIFHDGHESCHACSLPFGCQALNSCTILFTRGSFIQFHPKGTTFPNTMTLTLCSCRSISLFLPHFLHISPFPLFHRLYRPPKPCEKNLLGTLLDSPSEILPNSSRLRSILVPVIC